MLVTGGDSNRRTGGYLYNQQVLQALQRTLPAGAVGQIALPDGETTVASAALDRALDQLRPRLVIVDSIALLPVVAQLPHLSRDGVRVLALMHMLPSALATAPRPGSSPVAADALRTAERALLGAADASITVSPNMRDRLIAAGAPSDRVSVVLPGRDGVPQPATTPAARPRAFIRDVTNVGEPTGHRTSLAGTPTSLQRSRPDGAPAERLAHPASVRLLCVANWSPGKGIHLLVEAMAQLTAEGHPVRLDLVGEETVDAGYASFVYWLIRHYHLGRRIDVYGPLPPADLAARYAAADVFVLPSREEAFGIVYAEALSFGLPVIACRIGSVPWLLGDHAGLLVPPDNPAALARAMASLADSVALRDRLGAGARARAAQLPTWRETGEQFARIVLRLLGRAGDGAA